MYCPQCATENPDDAAFCKACGTDLRKYQEQWGRTAPGHNLSSTPDTTADATSGTTDSPAGDSSAAATDTGAAGTTAAPPQTPPPGYGTQPGYAPPAGPPPYQPYSQPHYQPGYQAPGQQTGYPQGYYQQRTYPPYQPGYDPARGYYTPPYVPSHMVWAILTLILCFFPTGIVAVVYASKVDGRLAMGDVTGAQDASRNAKIWSWVSFGIAVAMWIFWILVFVLVFTSAVQSGGTTSF
jgi:hypothetical protein